MELLKYSTDLAQCRHRSATMVAITQAPSGKPCLERQRERIVKAKARGATRAVCRQFGDRLPRNCG